MLRARLLVTRQDRLCLDKRGCSPAVKVTPSPRVFGAVLVYLGYFTGNISVRFPDEGIKGGLFANARVFRDLLREDFYEDWRNKWLKYLARFMGLGEGKREGGNG